MIHILFAGFGLIYVHTVSFSLLIEHTYFLLRSYLRTLA